MAKTQATESEEYDISDSAQQIFPTETRYEMDGKLHDISENQRVKSMLQEITGQKRVLSVPRVEGFDNSGVMSDKEVKKYLECSFPEQHVNNITMETVRYNDKYVGKNDRTELGRWEKQEPVQDMGIYNREIVVNRQTKAGNNDMELIKDTIAHEVGHQTYTVFLRHSERQDWERISGKRLEKECVSDYARTDAAEDFAETYRAYIRQPELLQNISPEKYLYMRDKVFYGREYKRKGI